MNEVGSKRNSLHHFFYTMLVDFPALKDEKKKARPLRATPHDRTVGYSYVAHCQPSSYGDGNVQRASPSICRQTYSSLQYGSLLFTAAYN
jgi:hypothetical protein